MNKKIISSIKSIIKDLQSILDEKQYITTLKEAVTFNSRKYFWIYLPQKREWSIFLVDKFYVMSSTGLIIADTKEWLNYNVIPLEYPTVTPSLKYKWEINCE